MNIASEIRKNIFYQIKIEEKNLGRNAFGKLQGENGT